MEVTSRSRTLILTLSVLLCFTSHALDFDQQELQILKGNNPKLEDNEGYLFFPFQLPDYHLPYMESFAHYIL